MAKSQRRKTTGRMRQYGRGPITVFRGAPLQRGHGIFGTLLRTLGRVAVPVLKRTAPIAKKVAVRAAKSAAKRTAKAGMKVLEDVVTKQNTIKGALKQRAQEAALNAALDAINKTKSSQKGNTTARQAKSKQQKKKRTNAPRL